MTCIVAMIDEQGNAWIGGDRACGDDGMTLPHPKVWMAGGALLGLSGDSVLYWALRHGDAPIREKGQHPMEWLSMFLAPWVQRKAQDAGVWVGRGSGGTRGWEGCLVVAVPEGIFRINNDAGVDAYARRWYSTVFSAEGALCLMHDHDKWPTTSRERVLYALVTASGVNPTEVRPPFDILTTRGNT